VTHNQSFEKLFSIAKFLYGKIIIQLRVFQKMN